MIWASSPQDVRVRLRLWMDLLTACGFVACAAVLAGGMSLGALVWRAVVWQSVAGGALSALLFALFVLAGAALCVGAWVLSCTRKAERTAVPLVVVMRWEAIAWGALAISLIPAVQRSQGIAFLLTACAFALGRTVAAARFDAVTRDALMIFLLTRIPILAIASFSAALMLPAPGHHVAASVYPALALWAHWDGAHYLAIARHGYSGTDIAFFPFYPALIRLGGRLIGSDILAAVAISNVCFYIALYLFRRYIEIDHDAETAQRATLYLAAFPAAFFFSAVYTESLFLCLTLGALYALRMHRRLLAGVLGGFAAATRVEGALLIIPYALDLIIAGDFSWGMVFESSALRRRLGLGAWFMLMGLVSYMSFSLLLTGDPLAFAHAQSHWQRHLAPPWVSVQNGISTVLRAHDPASIAIGSLELLFTLLAIALLVAAFKKTRLVDWSYACASLLVPLCTSSLMSMPRFAAVIFPLFIVLGVWGRSSLFHTSYLAIALPLLGVFTALFATWYWVA